MKKVLLCLLSLITLVGHAQTIRRVNNTPGVTGLNVYSDLQVAHDAASANDILLVEGSSNLYGDLVVSKPLKIYGPGYFNATNTELNADGRIANVGYVQFTTGSNGSEISGVHGYGGYDFTGSIAVFGASNITITRCFIKFGVRISNANVGSTQTVNVSGITLTRNYMYANSVAVNPNGAFTISNVIVSNNILDQNFLCSGTGSQIQNWVVRYNTFVNSNGIALINAIFENNIIYGGNTTAPSFSNVTYSYNVSFGNHFSGGVSNQNNFSMTGQFLGTGTGISEDEVYQIKGTSALKTAGSAGSEVGAYGGATPYIVSGVPPIPAVTKMTNTATGSNTVPLQVTISVKSNN
jgi:hypothetical protein